MRRHQTIALAALLVAPGCGGTDGQDGDASLVDAAVADAVSIDADPCAPTIVFANRNGGVYGPGGDDSVANTASWLTETTTITPWTTTSDHWNEVVDCARSIVAPYKIEIVDQDPGEVDHLEIIMTGLWPEDIGLESFDSFMIVNYGCDEELPRNIGIIFAGVIDLERRCQLVAATIANAAGIDETVDDNCDATYGGYDHCEETYSFTDEERTCGFNGEAGDCDCTGEATENPHQLMLAAYGAVCE